MRAVVVELERIGQGAQTDARAQPARPEIAADKRRLTG
jgi:hypothetical protein